MNRTNSDRIRAMTDEELAEIFVHHCTKKRICRMVQQIQKMPRLLARLAEAGV